MSVKLVKHEHMYALINDYNERISLYDVDTKTEEYKAFICYETEKKFRHQGYASLGLKLLKSELFKSNQIFILELMNLSNDYSRKVAENAGFFSVSRFGCLNSFIALHPFAEDIIKQNMEQFEKETQEYIKRERLLQKIMTMRKREKKEYIKLQEKLANLNSKLELNNENDEYDEYDENYRIELENEIRHIKKILNNVPQKNREEQEL